MGILYTSRNVMRVSPLLVFFAGMFAYLGTGDMLALRFSVYYIVTDLLVFLVKSIIGYKYKGLRRPAKAGDCHGCGYFSSECGTCTDVDNEMGFPSIHAISVTMAFSFWMWKVWLMKDVSRISKVTRTAILGVMVLLVLMSRSSMVEGCNSWPQLLLSSLAGVTIGSSFFALDELIKNKLPQKL